MNNAYETAQIEQEDPKQEAKSLDHISEQIIMLEQVMKSPAFKKFVKNFLEPRLQDEETILRTSRDGIRISQAQGAVRELEFVIRNLPTMLQALKNTTEHGT